MPVVAIADLGEQLASGLQPLYLIHGEEDLLRVEALDVLRAAAGIVEWLPSGLNARHRSPVSTKCEKRQQPEADRAQREERKHDGRGHACAGF